MAFNVNEIRSQLNFGGARNSLFQVTIQNPGNGVADIKVPFLVRAAQIPAATLGVIEVQVRFINNDDIDMPDLRGVFSYALDAGHCDRLAQPFTSNGSRINAERRGRPRHQDFFNVLLDKFLHVRENEYSLVRPVLDCVLAEFGDYVALPGACRQHQARVPFVAFLEPSVQVVNRPLLVIPQSHHLSTPPNLKAPLMSGWYCPRRRS